MSSCILNKNDTSRIRWSALAGLVRSFSGITGTFSCWSSAIISSGVFHLDRYCWDFSQSINTILESLALGSGLVCRMVVIPWSVFPLSIHDSTPRGVRRSSTEPGLRSFAGMLGSSVGVYPCRST